MAPINGRSIAPFHQQVLHFGVTSFDEKHAPVKTETGILAFYGFKKKIQMTTANVDALLTDLKVSVSLIHFRTQYQAEVVPEGVHC